MDLLHDTAEETDIDELVEEEIITPAWQTEGHHLEAHTLRKQASMQSRCSELAWSPGPNHSWVFDVPRAAAPTYDPIEKAPGNFIDDPHDALMKMCYYNRFQDELHQQLGTAC